MAAAQRTSAFLPALLAGLGAWLLLSRVANTAETARAFVEGVPPAAAPRSRASTSLRGFKEDFEAWRSSLSPEERAMVQNQAKNEFDKKYRKSDEFKKNLPEEKMKSFQQILGKFFDAEAEDYKKEVAARTPEYDGLTKRASEKKMDFSLKNRVVEVNREADRRYHFATMNIRAAQRKGELFPQSSPLTEKWVVQNDDEESHQKALDVLEFIKKAIADPSCPPGAKSVMEETVKQGIPPVGENIELPIPQVLANQLHTMSMMIADSVEDAKNELSEEEIAAWRKDKLPAAAAHHMKNLIDKYVEARDQVETEASNMKAFYRAQADMPGKTKADVLKGIWEELPKRTKKPLPPLDEEVLAELAEIPANVEGEYKHSWGTADVLYKSEAIDAFGMKYLLGVFETKDEAQKAFADWNAEYEKARVEMKAEMEQWGKQEQARLDRDTSGPERIKKVLEESRR